MKRVIAIIVVLLLLAAAIVWFEPSQTVMGRIRGEEFFDSRPTSYWVTALESDDPSVSSQAKEKLGGGGAPAAAVLDQILRTQTGTDEEASELRWTAAELLGRIGPDAQPYHTTLVGALDDPDPHVRTVAAQTLPKVSTPADVAVPALLKLLEGNERVDAARSISAYGKDAAPAIDALIKILGDKTKDSEARWNAARTLGKMREAGVPAIDALVKALKEDEAPTVREHAAEALGDIGPPARDAIPALIEALGDSYWKARRDSARALGQIDRTDPQVIAALEKTANEDADEQVREFAKRALQGPGQEESAASEAERERAEKAEEHEEEKQEEEKDEED